ncbi:MAG: hypothetical protein ACD_4C00101G0006 [uncultured bacterium (gcode 4)]|uniref:Type I restriction modification DNA specificity domain-containing protein n=1 Tax=uncultured bacterium (gcode 4) TaxID=1234023 RepID=K2G9X5_9BACT|nr:MAG: hypothetical protein ACD_4C00101G0006 [uncultured bacterium (gcode 4)]
MKQNWPIKKLKDICKKASSNISQNQLDNNEGDYPIYGASGVIKNVNFYHQDNEYVWIVKDGAWIWRITLLPAYSSVIGTLQYLIPNDGIDIRFFYYSLLSIDFLQYKNGSTIPHIYFKDYAEHSLSIPSLSEQKRIVLILDRAFEWIEQTRINTDKNLRNANKFFESYLKNILTNKNEDWRKEEFQNITNKNCSLWYGIVQPGNEFNNWLPVVRPTDLTNNQYIYKKGLKLIDPKLADSYKRTTLVGGELLLCVRGTTGIISIASDELKGANVTRGIVPIRFNEEIIDFKFAYYYFISSFIQKQIQEKRIEQH